MQLTFTRMSGESDDALMQRIAFGCKRVTGQRPFRPSAQTLYDVKRDVKLEIINENNTEKFIYVVGE